MNKKFYDVIILSASFFFFIFSGLWGIVFLLTKDLHYLIIIGINLFTAIVSLITYIYID